ncbi:MAG: glycosyltransferase [Paludibacteraceae bacterium]
MISIIVSTNNEIFLKNILENIHQTIGDIDYEIIDIFNPKKYSLCEAYNIGVERSKYHYLCFVHDDVVFRTNNWGERLVHLFENDHQIGLIGVVGNKFKSSYPSAIGQSSFIKKRYMRGSIIQTSTGYRDFDNSQTKKELEDVVCIDGVFMFTNKNVMNYCAFDDKLLTHFHGYDMDFSLQVFTKGLRVIVDREMLIEHISDGNYSKENTVANRLIGKKWRKELPVATNDLKLSAFRLHYFDLINWIYFFRKAMVRKLKNIK